MNDKYQDFLRKLQNADESERDWLVMEFSLQNISETLRQAVWAAAIPHWFDHDFLNAVIGNPLKDSDFQALIELSFVEVYPERGFNIHERSRNLLLANLWKTNKARFQKLSKRAAAYCKKQEQSITAWRVETIYHGVLAGNLKAKENFIEQGLDWYNSCQWEKLENLTKIILEAIVNTRLTGDIVAYAYDFQATLDYLYSRYESAKNNSTLALMKIANNKNLKADCLFNFGRVHYMLTEYDDARSCYQQALSLYQAVKNYLGAANCIKSLGNVHYMLAEYDNARSFYQKTLTIYKKINEPIGEASCILSFGNVHYSLAEYEEAKTCYQQALLIYREIKNRLGEANCIKVLGSLYGKKQQIELAISTLKQATALYENISDKESKANCFNNLATLYQREKQFKIALENFNQAIEIFPNEVLFYLNRAELYIEIDDYEKAEADIKHAETMGKNPAYTLLRKAELALWQQQTAQAVEFSRQALEKRPADGGFRALFALALLADGQNQAAETEMRQALTAIYEHCDFADLLDSLDKVAKIYGTSPNLETLREQILNTKQNREQHNTQIKP